MSSSAEELANEISLRRLGEYFMEKIGAVEMVDHIPPEELTKSAYSECYEKWEMYRKIVEDTNTLSGGGMVVQTLFLKSEKSTSELFIYENMDFPAVIQEFYEKIGFPLQEEISGYFKCISDDGLIQFVIYADYIEHFCFIFMVVGV